MSVAPSVLSPLTDILAREEEACDHLLATLHKERTAIRRLAIDDFQPINEDRCAILVSLEHLERERQQVVGQLSRAWGISEEHLTLQTIIAQLKSSAAQGLDERYVRLARKLRAVREEIAFNARLIEAIQSFVSQVLSCWTESGIPEGLYSSSGSHGGSPSSGTFLRQRI
jgi:flagellar biosynthesis/type III secretory pathway chaperone